METFFAIILIVVGVLQIILFFKVWKMCNDVSKLSIHFCGKDGNDSSFYAIRARMLAEDKSAVESAKKAMLSELNAILERSREMDDDGYKTYYGHSIMEDIESVIGKYKGLFLEAGENFPKRIANITTRDELQALFFKES